MTADGAREAAPGMAPAAPETGTPTGATAASCPAPDVGPRSGGPDGGSIPRHRVGAASSLTIMGILGPQSAVSPAA